MKLTIDLLLYPFRINEVARYSDAETDNERGREGVCECVCEGVGVCEGVVVYVCVGAEWLGVAVNVIYRPR